MKKNIAISETQPINLKSVYLFCEPLKGNALRFAIMDKNKQIYFIESQKTYKFTVVQKYQKNKIACKRGSSIFFVNNLYDVCNSDVLYSTNTKSSELEMENNKLDDLHKFCKTLTSANYYTLSALKEIEQTFIETQKPYLKKQNPKEIEWVYN